jgi:hypothetical protein
LSEPTGAAAVGHASGAGRGPFAGAAAQPVVSPQNLPHQLLPNQVGTCLPWPCPMMAGHLKHFQHRAQQPPLPHPAHSGPPWLHGLANQRAQEKEEGNSGIRVLMYSITSYCTICHHHHRISFVS